MLSSYYPLLLRILAAASVAAVAAVSLAGATGRAAQFSYIGCFRDKNETRDLNGLRDIDYLGGYALSIPYATVYSWHHMTVQYCSQVCSLGGFQYFSLQFYWCCFCDNSYGFHGALSESACNSSCTGNHSQKCGGYLANSVYSQTYDTASCARFVQSPRARLSVLPSYAQPTHWSVSASSALDCSLRCSSKATSCQAVLFSQQQRTCHLLRFALVPESLFSVEGDFYIRV